jgi:hypothetical protein
MDVQFRSGIPIRIGKYKANDTGAAARPEIASAV